MFTVSEGPVFPLLQTKLYGASPPEAVALRVTLVDPPAQTEELFGVTDTAICGFVKTRMVSLTRGPQILKPLTI